MNVKMIQIADRGVPTKERLHMTVSSDVDLVYYVVLDTVRLSEGKISRRPKHVYWFRTHRAKSGDTVILYTGAGEDTTKERPDGGSDHFFYWGLPSPIWEDAAACAVLMELNTWDTSPP